MNEFKNLEKHLSEEQMLEFLAIMPSDENYFEVIGGLNAHFNLCPSCWERLNNLKRSDNLEELLMKFRGTDTDEEIISQIRSICEDPVNPFSTFMEKDYDESYDVDNDPVWKNL